MPYLRPVPGNTSSYHKFDLSDESAFAFIGVLAVMLVIFLVLTRNCNRENTLMTENAIFNEETTPEASIINHQSTINNWLESFHLVNINDIDNSILVDLKYATADNFTGMVLYDGLHCAYLQPDVALMLAEAHRYLKTLHPGLRLLVYDAVRPLSVQRTMWERVKDTKYHRYVAHPERFSLHNYGAAVDLTLADSLGQPLDMGTPFDHFGRAAGISDEPALVNQGLLTGQQVQNRQLLRQVMRQAGFRSVSGEWWHFNACSLQEAKQRYMLVDF